MVLRRRDAGSRGPQSRTSLHPARACAAGRGRANCVPRLHTDDVRLKETAFEYLETATPPGTRELLLPLLEADAQNRLRAAVANGALEKLLASNALVNHKLNLKPIKLEVAR